MLLGDLGADVTEIEQPVTGDPFRAFNGGLHSPHFQPCKRNKRSVMLDTKDAQDRKVFDALISDADAYQMVLEQGALSPPTQHPAPGREANIIIPDASAVNVAPLLDTNLAQLRTHLEASCDDLFSAAGIAQGLFR